MNAELARRSSSRLLLETIEIATMVTMPIDKHQLGAVNYFVPRLAVFASRRFDSNLEALTKKLVDWLGFAGHEIPASGLRSETLRVTEPRATARRIIELRDRRFETDEAAALGASLSLLCSWAMSPADMRAWPGTASEDKSGNPGLAGQILAGQGFAAAFDEIEIGKLAEIVKNWRRFGAPYDESARGDQGDEQKA